MEKTDHTSPPFYTKCAAHTPANQLHRIDYHVTVRPRIEVRLSDFERLRENKSVRSPYRCTRSYAYYCMVHIVHIAALLVCYAMLSVHLQWSYRLVLQK